MSNNKRSKEEGSEQTLGGSAVAKQAQPQGEKPGYGTVGEQLDAGRLIVFAIIAAAVIAAAIALKALM
ncbi:MAG: hypothetical protein ACOX6T_04110 [Myxococcales bacterium]|jgi:hypothetical protein